jgi:hypothetical protein
MDTNALKKFAQAARNLLIDQVTSKLALVIDPASNARREHPDAMKKLDATIAAKGQRQVVEQVAYTWFNRFTALRFMDVNGYTNPASSRLPTGATRPEILADAMAGNLPKGAPARTLQALLEDRIPSNNPQAEAYRLLLVHACNQWHSPMPFLFEEIDDYTELLMPEDLLSPSLDPRRAAQGDDRGRLRGCRDHRLALPVLHLGEEGSGLRGAEEERRSPPRTSPPRRSSSPRTGSSATWWRTRWGGCGC